MVGSCVMVILEGRTKSLMNCLTAMVKEENTLGSLKMLLAREKNKCRVFPAFNIQLVNIPTAETYDTFSDFVPEIADIYCNLLGLGDRLSQVDHHKRKEILETLSTKMSDVLPAGELLASIVRSPSLMDGDEFVQLYGRSQDLTLEGEATWPVQRFVKYL